MQRQYLGTLDYRDPLYEILLSTVCPYVHDPLFHVKRMNVKRVYKYTEEKSGIAIIGKFYRLDDPRQERILRIKGEFEKLVQVRRYGFDAGPHYVVRPIAREERIGLALVEDFVRGKDLDHYVKRAIYEGRTNRLRDRLSKLAAFLYTLHTKTEGGEPVQPDMTEAYFRKIVSELRRQTLLCHDEKKRFLGLMDRWLGRDIFQGTPIALLHGDATPTNFLFTERNDIVAIDFERMKKGDSAFDIGMVCGELKHAFLWRTGDPFAAEPFIRYFLDSYAGCCIDPGSAFRAITRRNPFYMALTELRIARNDYLHWDYRKRLVHEAKECLSWGLKIP